MTNQAHTPTPGSKVTGTYYDQSYSGTVESTRPNTMRHDVQVYHVILDSEITVYGDTRKSICVECDCVTGQEAQGYGPSTIKVAS